MPNYTKNITAMANALRALVLWGRHLRHNPAQPQWADLDGGLPSVHDPGALETRCED